MQQDDTSVHVQVVQTQRDMFRDTARRQRGGRGRWALLTPTVLWSVVILAMAPSFYGFAGGLSSLPTGISAGRSGVEAAELPGWSDAKARADSAVGARKSPFAAASWLKERVQDGKRRVRMQVGECASIPEMRDVCRWL